MELNKIYNENCIDTMSKMPDLFVDLTLTSPPYDDLRTYKGYSFDFERIAKELYRVTKPGGVVVWVVNDATKNGSESLTSFKQILFFNALGFNVETMIWEKTGNGCLGSNKLYSQNFEYMFVLSKGTPKTTNLICDRENKVKSGKAKVNGGLDKTGKGVYRVIERKPLGKRSNIWVLTPQQRSKHPAPFPEQLANDHIVSWSNEGDLIYDPFIGSGTTAKMAILNNRKFIGSEISQEYCEEANLRIFNAGGVMGTYFGKGCPFFTGQWERDSDEENDEPVLTYCVHPFNPDTEHEGNCCDSLCPLSILNGGGAFFA